MENEKRNVFSLHVSHGVYKSPTFYGTLINPLLIFRSESSEQINGKSSESYKSCETTSDAKRII